MADELDSLERRVREARSAKAWLCEARALLESNADAVTFSCANPPYAGLFQVDLPRSLWAPGLEAAIEAEQSKVDAVTAMTVAR